MHEVSIAQGLIDQIMEIASFNNLSEVNEIEIITGELRNIVPDVMQAAFRAVSQGTIVEKAILKIEEKESQAKCHLCEKNFKPSLNDFLCPDCQVADVSIIQGNEIILKSVISYS